MNLEELREVLCAATGRQFGVLRPEQELSDLGLESVDRVRVIARLEQRLQREIDERLAMSLRTVAELLALASDSAPAERQF